MTEAEWLASTDPEPMLILLGSRVSSRKLRLLVCAWCFDAWQDLPDARSREAVWTAEAFADGVVGLDELAVASTAARAAYAEIRRSRMIRTRDRDRRQAFHSDYAAAERAWLATSLQLSVEDVVESPDWQRGAQLVTMAARVREVFGNPFRRVRFEPHWRTSDVLGIARAVYHDRAFDRMPILADALMDAGCADEQVLEHCRSSDSHVRGCWLVDLVLDQS